MGEAKLTSIQIIFIWSATNEIFREIVDTKVQESIIGHVLVEITCYFPLDQPEIVPGFETILALRLCIIQNKGGCNANKI